MTAPHNPHAPVHAVVLAAGGSSRLGRPKQLERIGGMTLVRRATLAVCGLGASSIIVVTGAYADEVRRELAGMPLSLVDNPDWRRGVGSSIRAGVLACDVRPGASILLMTCDQIGVTRPYLRQLIQRFRDSRSLVAASQYAETVGVPAIFAGALREELLELGDDEGGKRVIERHKGGLVAVPFDGGSWDVDTEQDVARARALVERRMMW